MTTTTPSRIELPALPLAEWEPTKKTLHLWVQIVGKVRMATAPPRNHWWHAALHIGVRGLTTRRLRAANGIAFEIVFDFVDHRLVVSTDTGEAPSFELGDGLSVAEFDEKLHATLASFGVDVPIRESPFGVPMTTPFPEDREHAAYDRDAVDRFWQALGWSEAILEEFAGWYCGKTSPVHLFWHSLDLALTRFGGPRASAPPKDPVNREAYSHEVVSFGFWPGDDNVREPTFYAYAAPEPEGLRDSILLPVGASWNEGPTGSLALLPYDTVRTASNSKAALLAFLESAYQAGAGALGWPRDDLRSSWCPSPPELSELLERQLRGGAE